MKEKLLYIGLFLLALISLEFFDARFINPRLVRYLNFITIVPLILMSFAFFFKFNGGFVIPIQILILSILFSMVMARFSWAQGFKDSLIDTYQYLLWSLFFLLLYLKISVRILERIVLVCGVLYVLLYFFQFANSHTVYFGKPISGDEFLEQRGIVRIVFPGAGIFVLSIFIAVTKLTTQRPYWWFWLGFTLLGLIIPIMQVTRQFIAGIFLIYIYHFMKNQTMSKKILVISLVIGSLIIAINSDIPMIDGLIETQSRDAKLGKDYIRIKAGKYFIEDFSPNTWSYIFGNGSPSWGISSYGKFVERLSLTREYFLSDVGIIAVYAMFGLFAVLALILIWIKSFQIPVPEKYAYVKYYLWYLLFTSATWYSVYHYHYLIATVFVLYIYQRIYVSQKHLLHLNKQISKLNSVSELEQKENRDLTILSKNDAP